MGEKPIALPVAGVFEVRAGKIAASRDYFDLASYQRQLGQPDVGPRQPIGSVQPEERRSTASRRWTCAAR